MLSQSLVSSYIVKPRNGVNENLGCFDENSARLPPTAFQTAHVDTLHLSNGLIKCRK